MPDLILLCAGAASDRAPFDDLFPFDTSGLRARLRAGAFQRGLRNATLVTDLVDNAALPTESPEDHFLRTLFGVPPGDAVQAWRAAHFGITLPAWEVSPCHVQVGHSQLVLSEPDGLQLQPEEAYALAEAVRNVFAASGFALSVAAPLHWYLNGNEDWALGARARTMATGRSIDGYLPDGPRAREWRRLFTETQIAWHEHPVNLARQARGLQPVNALWLDGCARSALPVRGGTLVATQPELLGLASAAGMHAVASPWTALTRERLDALMRDAGTGALVIDVAAWRDARRRGDMHGWQEAWDAFDRWLDDTGLTRRGSTLSAFFSAERRWLELRRESGMAWRFWQRCDPLRTVLGQ